MIARHNGRCTLCSRFVRKGRSRIDTLSLAMPADPEHASYDRHFNGDRGRWIVAGEVFHTKMPPASTWQHEDCVAAFLRKHGHDYHEHKRIADERTAALRAMRERSTATQRTGDHWPTRRAKQRAAA